MRGMSLVEEIDKLVVEAGHRYGENKFHLEFDDIKEFIIRAWELGKKEKKRK